MQFEFDFCNARATRLTVRRAASAALSVFVLSASAAAQIGLSGEFVSELRRAALNRYAAESTPFEGVARRAGGDPRVVESSGRVPGTRVADIYTGLQASGNFYWRYTAPDGGGIAYWSLDDGAMGATGVAAGGAHVLQYEFAYGIYSVGSQDPIRPAVVVSFFRAPADPVGGAMSPVVQEAEAVSSVLWVFDAPARPAGPSFSQIRTGLLNLASRNLDFVLDDTFYFELLPMNWPDYPNGQPVISGKVHSIFTGPSSLSYGSNADFMWSDVAIRSVSCTGPFPANANGIYENPTELDTCHFSPFLNRSPLRLIGDPCSTPNAMRLDCPDPMACVRPGDPIVVSIGQACIPGALRSFQSFVQFDPSRLNFVSGTYDPNGPYSLPIVFPISASGGNVDLSAEVDASNGQQPTSLSAPLATLNFTAGNVDGFTQVTFRSSDPPNCYSDHEGMVVLPSLVDSPVVCIDGTPPQISAPPAIDWSCTQPLPPPAADYAGFIESGGTAVDQNACYGPMQPAVVHVSDVVGAGSGCAGDPKLVTRTYRATDCAGNSSDAVQIIRCFDTQPPTVVSPADRTVSADAGTCEAIVTWPNASATDDCAGDVSASIIYAIDLNDDLTIDATVSTNGFTFPAGSHRVIASATDACGQSGSDEFHISVLPVNRVLANVQMQGAVNGGRCILFEFWNCGQPTPVQISAVVNFSSGIAQDTPLEVPCGIYDCVTARDPLHSLRRTDESVEFVAGVYRVDFTGADQLVGGNLNDDLAIDLLDFGIYMTQFRTNFGATGTDCATASPHADISGNGLVFTEDFTYLQTNFGFISEANCCGHEGLQGGGHGPGATGPVLSIAVSELVERGLGDLGIADLNHDNVLDLCDLTAFLGGARPRVCGPAMAR